MTPRAVALARLLEDWEAGRMTGASDVDSDAVNALKREGLVELWTNVGRQIVTLTPAGLATARAQEDTVNG